MEARHLPLHLHGQVNVEGQPIQSPDTNETHTSRRNTSEGTKYRFEFMAQFGIYYVVEIY